MLPGKQALSQLLESLYGAAADAALWPDFLRRLADAAHGDSAALLMHHVAEAQHAIALHSGVDEDAVRRYANYYGKLDTWVQYSPLHAGVIEVSDHVCPFPKLERTEFYNDYLRQYDIAHAMWGVLQSDHAGLLNVGVYRGRHKGAFELPALDLLRFLEPHLKRAFQLHLQMSDLKARRADLEQGLNAIAVGVLLLGARGRILAMNRAAERICAEQDGLHASGHRLRLETTNETAHADKLIAEAIQTSVGRGLAPGGAMLISRKARTPLQLVVTPVRGFPMELGHRVMAIAFVSDPEGRATLPFQCLMQLFGLTPAECRLTMLLAEGHGLREIADNLGLTINTLKSQLGSIYRKTNTSRQAELIARLAKLAVVTNGDQAR